MWVGEVNRWLVYNQRSQAWLAEQGDVSRFHLSKCLNGHLRPSNELLGRLERVMREWGLPEAINLLSKGNDK